MAQSKDLVMSDALESTQKPTVARSSGFQLPDWAPLAVLGVLVTFGLLGGMGVLPITLKSELAKAPPNAEPDAEPARRPSDVPGGGPRVQLKERHTGSKPPAAAAAPAAAPADAGVEATISVAHLVVAHHESTLGKAKNVTRTREEARKRAEEALARARKGEDFGKLVAEYSDEANAATRRGKFSGFRRTDAIAPFGDTAYALKPAEVSNVIETKLGFHVIRRD
jgi:hypothetical protein